MSNFVKFDIFHVLPLLYYYFKFFTFLPMTIILAILFIVYRNLGNREMAIGFRNAMFIAILPIIGVILLILGPTYLARVFGIEVISLPSSLTMIVWILFGCFLIPSGLFFMVWVTTLLVINIIKKRYKRARAYFISLLFLIPFFVCWWISRGYGTYTETWGW